MNTQIQQLEPDQPNDFRNYYYYENDDIKVDVKFIKLDDGEYSKIVTTYYIKAYSTYEAQKVKERLKWDKFGQATNSDNMSFTKIGEDVFIDINPELKLHHFKKKEIKPKYEHYKKIYYTINEKTEEIQKIEKNNQSIDPEPDSDSVTYKINTTTNPTNVIGEVEKNKRKLVSCRHCGSGDHWSVDCIVFKQKNENMKNNKKYDGNRDSRDGNRDSRDGNRDSRDGNRDSRDGNRDGRDGRDNKRERTKDESNVRGLKITELDSTLSNNEIKNYLSKYGNISYYNNVIKDNKEVNSLVYVTYTTQEENDSAYEKLQRCAVGYTIPCVEYAKQKKSY